MEETLKVVLKVACNVEGDVKGGGGQRMVHLYLLFLVITI